MGIACVPDASEACVYAAGYVPWSEPKMYDTGEPGRSNRGHEKPVAGLGETEKWDIIEYLKTL